MNEPQAISYHLQVGSAHMFATFLYSGGMEIPSCLSFPITVTERPFFSAQLLNASHIR
jgi:hypothetical protein